MLDVRSMTVRFGGLTAVSDLDFSVEPGRILAIIGPNGAGKTTVFNAITAIHDPDPGRIEFQGREIRRPLTWKVVAACALVAVLAGAFLAAVAGDVDLLWKAAINETNCDPARFEWSRVFRDGVRYLTGKTQVRAHGSEWEVVPYHKDRRRILFTAPTEAEAELLRADGELLLAATEVRRDGDRWAIAAGDGRLLQTFETEDAARCRQAICAREYASTLAHRWKIVIFGLLGLALGATTMYVVWARTRRTPDVVARQGISRTFQNIRLFRRMTALENVLVALDTRDRSVNSKLAFLPPALRRSETELRLKAMELLQFVGLESRAAAEAGSLPYGEQRRLEIARALATEPKLLLLDEPAAGMNPIELQSLMKLIQDIQARGITVLLIEHHMKMVMGISEHIVVLDHGVKIAEGTPESVRNDPKVLEAYLGREEA